MLPHYLGLSEKLTDIDMLDQSGRKLHFIFSFWDLVKSIKDDSVHLKIRFYKIVHACRLFNSFILNCHFDFWHVRYMYLKCFNQDKKVKTTVHHVSLEKNSWIFVQGRLVTKCNEKVMQM